MESSDKMENRAPVQPEPAAVRLPEAGTLVLSSSPHIRTSLNITKIMAQVMLCLLPAVIMAVCHYRWNAVRVILRGLYTKYPLAQVIVITPLQRNSDPEIHPEETEGLGPNKQGKYLADYVDRDGKIPIVDVSIIMSAVDRIEQLFQTIDIKKCWLYKYSSDFRKSVDEMYEHKEDVIKSLQPKF